MKPDTSKIELNSSRITRLTSLNQCLTYEGLLEGLPTTQMNERIIKRTLEKAKRPYADREPYLIQPIERPIEYKRDTPYPFGTPASLPGVICEAVLKSLEPARDAKQDYSWLTVVWFQSAFALPIDEEVLKQIQMINWEEAAQDELF